MRTKCVLLKNMIRTLIIIKKRGKMTKNNLKVVKSTKDQDLDKKEKNKALDAAINQITDTFGKGSVMKLGQQTAMDIESISTGSLSLDLALGIGGFQKEELLKFMVLSHQEKPPCFASCSRSSKNWRYMGFVDAEHALDPVYAKKLGVDTEEF
ncbi:MAG: hypothetical protein Ct9H300mP5_3130 [Candidatus Pelagibacterales bacterium]|nr:MAG: hypothetical protein Ct9H300mP5_3130 [Pelagibacterales bacterium]